MNDFLENNWERLTSLWRMRRKESYLRRKKRYCNNNSKSGRHATDWAPIVMTWITLGGKYNRKGVENGYCRFVNMPAMFVLGVSLVYVATRPEPEEKIVRAEVIKPGRLQAELRLGTGVRLALNEHQGVYSSENAVRGDCE